MDLNQAFPAARQMLDPVYAAPMLNQLRFMLSSHCRKDRHAATARAAAGQPSAFHAAGRIFISSRERVELSA
jgi:hypothetical protein